MPAALRGYCNVPLTTEEDIRKTAAMDLFNRITVSGNEYFVTAVKDEWERQYGFRIRIAKGEKGHRYLLTETSDQVDSIMRNRPHRLKGRIVRVRRYNPGTRYPRKPVSSKVELKVRTNITDHSELKAELEAYFARYGAVLHLTHYPSDREYRRAVLIFDDYDSVDLLMLVSQHMEICGKPSPFQDIETMPGKRIPIDKESSSTSWEHIMAVGLPTDYDFMRDRSLHCGQSSAPCVKAEIETGREASGFNAGDGCPDVVKDTSHVEAPLEETQWSIRYWNGRSPVSEVLHFGDPIYLRLSSDARAWSILGNCETREHMLKVSPIDENVRILSVESVNGGSFLVNRHKAFPAGRRALIVDGDRINSGDVDSPSSELYFSISTSPHQGPSLAEERIKEEPMDATSFGSQAAAENRPTSVEYICIDSDDSLDVGDELIMNIKSERPSEESTVVQTEKAKTTEVPGMSMLRSKDLETYSPFDLNVDVQPAKKRRIQPVETETKTTILKNPEPNTVNTETTMISDPRRSGKKHANEFTTSYSFFLKCILNIQVGNAPSDAEHECERPFVTYLRKTRYLSTAQELAKSIFSRLCLEGSRRVAKALRKKSDTVPWLKAAVVSEEQIREQGLMRITLIALCPKGSGLSLSNCSAVHMKSQFMRLGGGCLGERCVLGAVYRTTRIDRSGRSGGVAIPPVLTEHCRNPELVDQIVLDFDVSKFEGSRIRTDELVEIRLVSEVREIRRLLYVNRIPKAYVPFLLHPEPEHIWGRNRSKTTSLAEEHQIHNLDLTTAQRSVVSAALSLLKNRDRGVPTALVVNGVCGSGKTRCIAETALQVAMAAPNRSVVIFSKWSRSADNIALVIQGKIDERRLRFRDNDGESRPMQVTRVTRSSSLALNLSMAERLARARGGILRQEREKDTTAINELHDRILQFERSLENQLEWLSESHRRRKLSEIASMKKHLSELLSRRDMPDRVESLQIREEDILRRSNVVVCCSSDTEKTPFYECFAKQDGNRVSMVLFDQAHQVLQTDIMGLTALNCPRWVMIGDTSQHDLYAFITRHPALKGLKERETIFERFCNKFSDDVFTLHEQFRLTAPLDRIVNEMLYEGKMTSSRMIEESKNPGLTLVDLGTGRESDMMAAFKKILRSLSVCFGSLSCLVADNSFSKYELMFDGMRTRDTSITAITIAQLLWTEVGVLIVPASCPDLLGHLSVDDTAIRNLITRPSRSLIIVGDLGLLERDFPTLRHLIRKGSEHGRRISVSAARIQGMGLNEILAFFTRPPRSGLH